MQMLHELLHICMYVCMYVVARDLHMPPTDI